jgi:PAS domain S-box-containing protein
MSLKAEDPARLQHEELHAEILRDVSDAVIATDRAMRIVTWNEAACRMYGWTKEEALGSVLDDLLQTRFITTSQPEAQRLLIENRYWAGQIEQTTKDGIQLTVDARVSLLTGPDGEAIGGVTVNRDVTEEYLLRTLLRIQRDMLVRIGSADTAVDVAQIALQSTCKLDGIECGAVYLRSEVGTGDVLEMVTSIGIPTHDVTVVARIPLDRPIFREMVTQPVPHYGTFDAILGRAGVDPEVIAQFTGMRGAAIVPIVGDGEIVGTVHVASCIYEKIPALTREFLEQLSAWLGDIVRKKFFQQELETAEKKLRSKSDALTEANTALKVILRAQRDEQDAWRSALRDSYDRRIRPVLSRLKETIRDGGDGGLLDVMELEIEALMRSPGADVRPASLLSRLTPREAQVAALIRSDHSTKEIAARLSISTDAVAFHRKRIRQKLGITGTGKNLRQILSS